MGSSLGIDGDIEHISFSTIREDFSEFKAENGQILRMKPVVMDIIREQKNGKQMSSLTFQEYSHVITELKIDTSGYTFAEASSVTDADKVKELNFVIIKRVINIYETEQSIILVSPDVEKIFLTNKKDKTNSPYLRYVSKTNVNVVQKAYYLEEV